MSIRMSLLLLRHRVSQVRIAKFHKFKSNITFVFIKTQIALDYGLRVNWKSSLLNKPLKDGDFDLILSLFLRHCLIRYVTLAKFRLGQHPMKINHWWI